MFDASARADDKSPSLNDCLETLGHSYEKQTATSYRQLRLWSFSLVER